MTNIIDIKTKLKKKTELRPDISPRDDDFKERTKRIKDSLEKINSLMAELKKMSKDK